MSYHHEEQLYQQQKEKTSRKNKRKDKNKSNNVVDTFYNNITFQKRISSGRPGTPHRYFASSYHVVDNSIRNNDNGNGRMNYHSLVIEDYVVHCHVNGLCILTIGDAIKTILDNQNIIINGEDRDMNSSITASSSSNSNSDSCSCCSIDNIQFMVNVTKSQSVGQKRKAAKKMKRGDTKIYDDRNRRNEEDGDDNDDDDNDDKSLLHQGIIKTGDILLKITLTNGLVINVLSCICGTVLELNSNLIDDPSLLIRDPLLDGYLSVVLPNGSFPPLSKIVNTTST